MLLNASKCQGYSFYLFCVKKGKRTGGKFTSNNQLKCQLFVMDSVAQNYIILRTFQFMRSIHSLIFYLLLLLWPLSLLLSSSSFGFGSNCYFRFPKKSIYASWSCKLKCSLAQIFSMEFFNSIRKQLPLLASAITENINAISAPVKKTHLKIV